MKYYLMPLTNTEQLQPKNKGFAFALNNKDRWIEMGDAKDEVNTYDRGTTVLVYKNIPYNIFKDYVSIDEQYRVYIGCQMNYDYDRLTEASDDYEYTSKKGADGKKPTPKKVSANDSLAEKIKSSATDLTLQVEAGKFEEALVFGAVDNIVVNGAKAGVAANKGSRATSEIGEDETVISGNISVNGSSDVVLDGLTFTDGAKITFAPEYSGKFSIKNCKFVSLAKGDGSKTMAININKGSLCTLDVRNNYFGSNDGSVYNGLELTGELTDGSIIANNTFAKGFTTHNAINIYNVMNGATVYVNNNYCETVDFARIGIIGEPSCKISFNGNKYEQTATDEWNSPIIVQPYGKQTTSFKNCKITISDMKPIADEDLLVVAYGANDTDVSKKLPIVQIGGKYVTPTVKTF